MFSAYEIIRKKRDGVILSKEEIEFFVKEYTSGRLPDYQASSLAMAIFFSGMSDEEILDLTEAMISTGIVVDLSGVHGPKVDKHSTGGVGDKISLMLAPLAAACGVKVPMVSGRGLGHTGGTIDKLESIPGFRTGLSIGEYKRILMEVGLVMSAQSEDIVPADRKLYALRDVTATVESIPLITSSIMSKKLAEGIDALVLDVKVGSGAFIKKVTEARKLAKKMVKVGKLHGKKVAAYLTDMNQPLGREVGNWNEVVESIDVLKGEKTCPDVLVLTKQLTAEVVSLGTGESLASSKKRVSKAIESGSGYEKFLEMVRAQGGDTKVVQNPDMYPVPKLMSEVKSAEGGYVASIDSFGIGMAVVKLGGGRMKFGDKVDPVVGVTIMKKVGDKVSRGETLAIVKANDQERADAATRQIVGSYVFTGKKPAPIVLIKERIT